MLNRVLNQPRLQIASILGVCLLLYFPFLGARDFWDQENMYAEVTRVMLLGDNWAVPQMNGELWLDNPPLFFWLAGFVSWLAGDVNEWTMRLTPAVSATFLVLVVYLYSSKRFTARIAFLSTLVFATSLLTVHVERHVPINMVFYLFVVVVMFLLMEVLVFDSPRLIHVYGAWFFLALACLTKGPIAILLPGLVAGTYIIISGCWRKVIALRPLTGAGLFLAVAAPWFVFVNRRTSIDWTGPFFTAHNHLGDGHSSLYHYFAQLPGSIFYSLVNFPLDFMPWTFFFVPAVIGLWPQRSHARRGAGLFLFLWFLCVFLFPHLSVVEHSHYLFLILVPTAVVVAVHLDRILSATSDETARRWTAYFLLVFCYFVAALGIALPFVAAFQWPELALQNVAVGVAGVIGALWLLYALKQHHYQIVALGFAALMIVINLLVQGLVLPPVNRLQVRPFAESMQAILKPESAVGVYLYHLPPFREFNFYSRVKRIQVLDGPNDVINFLSRPGPRFILVTERRRDQVEKLWHGELKPVLAQGGGGLGWWFPSSGRWLLLSSCSGCDATSAVDSRGKRVATSQ
jgi:4-amino-4-deoxy-L-arabinose transferase-like glycosyltransferase